MCYVYDNKVAINIVHNLVYYDRAKHVEMDRHSIKEKLQKLHSGQVCTPYVTSTKQLADAFTKVTKLYISSVPRKA